MTPDLRAYNAMTCWKAYREAVDSKRPKEIILSRLREALKADEALPSNPRKQEA